MQIFISGTDTNIGKTLICNWLCLQAHYAYFKPIQTGALEQTDSSLIHERGNVQVYPETFCYQAPLSPHLAAATEGQEIDINNIVLPNEKNLIVEGAGGVLVPLNKQTLLIDLIRYLSLPLIIVASSRLGTINHTLLTLEAIKKRKIHVLGVIMNGPLNQENKNAIEYYGEVEVLAQMPWLEQLNESTLKNIPLPNSLSTLLRGSS
jgi:dethiobiotin synthase